MSPFHTQELLPPSYESSGDEVSSSDGETPEYESQRANWAIGGFPGEEGGGEADLSDLWVTEDTAPLTEKRGRKFSLLKR